MLLEAINEANIDTYGLIKKSMIKEIVNAMFSLMRGKFRNFPNDYMVIDIETTGVQDNDLITQLGYCFIRSGETVSCDSLVLNWTLPQYQTKFPINKLRSRLDATKKHVEQRDGKPTGRTYHMSIEKMASEGGDPIEVLTGYRELLADARNNGVFFVSHNGYHFDANYLENHFRHFTGVDFTFGDNEMVDTGMIAKSAYAGMMLWSGESIREWSTRVYEARLRGIRWSLDGACVNRFGIAKKHNLDMSKAHDAGFDCLLTSFLLEEYKAIARGERGEPD